MRRILLVCLAVSFIGGCSFSGDTKDDDQNKKATDSVSKQQDKQNKDKAVEKDAAFEEQQNDDENSPMEQDMPDIPSNYEDAVDYPESGKFAGKSYDEQKEDIEKTLDKLPKLTDENDENASQYHRYIFSLFAENFSMPNVPIEQWNAMTIGDPGDSEDEEKQAKLKEYYQVAVLLDSSGSMANEENGTSRLDLAKESINNFVSALPEKAQVSLRVYGHKGTGSEADKKKSCESIETVYPLDSYQSGKFQTALGKFQPAGWTPLASAIEEVTDDFKQYDGKEYTNIIYVVSDGVETCGGDPVKAVKQLADSNIKPAVNIIGYQVNNEGVKQLKEMAKAADGRYINVHNQEQLNEEFGHTEDMSHVWGDWHKGKQNAIKKLHQTMSKQIHGWYDEMTERKKRQKENLDKAIAYLEENRDLDYGYMSSNEYRQNRLGLDNDIRTLYISMDTDNRLSFLKKSNDARMKYLDHVN